jgi:hypothetical protein
MSILFRAILIAASVIATCSVMIKIRRAKMQIEDAVFWVLFSFLLIILALFPPVLFFFTGLLKMQSPANLLFLIIIFLLFAKVFSMSVKLSRQEEMIKTLTQEIALEKEKEEEKK